MHVLIIVSAKLCLTHKPKHKNHFGSPQLY